MQYNPWIKWNLLNSIDDQREMTYETNNKQKTTMSLSFVSPDAAQKATKTGCCWSKKILLAKNTRVRGLTNYWFGFYNIYYNSERILMLLIEIAFVIILFIYLNYLNKNQPNFRTGKEGAFAGLIYALLCILHLQAGAGTGNANATPLTYQSVHCPLSRVMQSN